MNRYSLVMLPGLDGTGIMFRPIIDELKVEVDPVVISYEQHEECSYNALANEVEKRLPNNDFFILGESFSGPIAIMLASRKPKRLKGIILCASFISNPSTLFPSFLRFLVRAPLFYIWPVSIKANVLMSGRADGKLKDLMRETKKITKNSALASRTREVLRVNVAEELKLCECPILYLRGSRDIIVSRRNLMEIKEFKDNISDVTLDASHLILQETPHDSSREIIKFISEIHESLS